MKKYLLLFTVLFLVVGCEIPQNGLLKKSKISKNTIEFKDSIIVLSEEYTKIEPEEFKNQLDSIKEKPRFVKIALEELEKIQKRGPEFKLFVDENNLENYVFVYSRDYIQFDEYKAQRYVSRLNSQLKDESNIQELRYKRIHGRYFFTQNSKVVKLKYIKSYKKDSKFGAEYIVATKAGGIGLLVSNLKDVDFEKSVKRLALR